MVNQTVDFFSIMVKSPSKSSRCLEIFASFSDLSTDDFLIQVVPQHLQLRHGLLDGAAVGLLRHLLQQESRLVVEALHLYLQLVGLAFELLGDASTETQLTVNKEDNTTSPGEVQPFRTGVKSLCGRYKGSFCLIHAADITCSNSRGRHLFRLRPNLRLYLELHNLLFDSFQVCADGRHGIQFAFQDVHPVEHALRYKRENPLLLTDDMAQHAESHSNPQVSGFFFFVFK